MKFPRYLELFRSRWWVIVLAGLICAVAAYGVSTRVLKKQYTATETFEVNIPGNQSTTSNSTAPSLVATDSQLLTSYPVAQRAISVLGLTKTVFPDQLTSSTACTPSDLAQTFSCTLTWRDPKLAASLLDKLGQVAIDTNRQNQARVFQPLILQVQQTIKSTKLDLSQAQSQQQSRGASAGLAGRIDTDQVALT
ncbi:MAG: Wzz/FepE/Etk N-terminal domain-containing protein, partial [Chloroflexota bacterium]